MPCKIEDKKLKLRQKSKNNTCDFNVGIHRTISTHSYSFFWRAQHESLDEWRMPKNTTTSNQNGKEEWEYCSFTRTSEYGHESFQAGSEWNPARYWKYITGTDRRSVRAHTVLRLDASFNTRYAVKYAFFARILSLCRAQIITIPTIHIGSLHTKLPMRMVKIVIIW
jgi:hypothetical protein